MLIYGAVTSGKWPGEKGRCPYSLRVETRTSADLVDDGRMSLESRMLLSLFVFVVPDDVGFIVTLIGPFGFSGRRGGDRSWNRLLLDWRKGCRKERAGRSGGYHHVDGVFDGFVLVDWNDNFTASQSVTAEILLGDVDQFDAEQRGRCATANFG